MAAGLVHLRHASREISPKTLCPRHLRLRQEFTIVRQNGLNYLGKFDLFVLKISVFLHATIKSGSTHETMVLGPRQG
jgi:hypothetical protein